MSQDAIGKIMDAEEQAEVLCRVAKERAEEMRAEMTRQGEYHLAEVEKATAAEYAEKLNEMRAGAQALQEEKRVQAQEEAQRIKDTARERMDEAVKMIVWGIVEKCQ